MASSVSSKRSSKKSAFSCEACRKRKVKCGAEHPICNRCKIRGDTCDYKLNPTLSYTQRLEQQVEKLEAALSDARRSAGDFNYRDALDDHFTAFEALPRPTSSGTVENLKAEDDGMLTLRGSTSLFELPGSIRARSPEQSPRAEDMSAKEDLVNSAWRERAFEQLADIPEPFRSLLDSHFCWIQPLFNFVYRPVFTRDMKSGGPYFSKALLNAIMAHSVRWCRIEPGMDQLLAPFDYGAEFSKNAVKHVFEDIQHGNNKVPTVQTLLMLSAQQCGCGNRTQAWLYSGMAFRLIDDMGICVDGKRAPNADHYSAEEIEIRNRLFWSCYFWDKLISLYFGRTPMLQHSEISPPRVLMDDSSEIELWVPHGLLSPTYMPKQAHSISCFIHMCGLAEILNQILRYLYNPTRELPASRAYQCALAEGTKLRNWWRDLPEHLKINLAATTLECPPSHILTLNCLYHTINILLHRAKLKLGRDPSLASVIADHSPLIQCISSATSIVALYGLFVRTFGEGHVVLSLAYSVYTATSIFLLEVQAIGHAAPSNLERLSVCLGILERLRQTNPVLGTAMDLIMKELQALGVRTPDLFPSTPTEDISLSLASRPLLPLPAEQIGVSSPSSLQLGGSIGQADENLLLDMSYFNGQMEGSMNYNLFNMPPETYEAFSLVEPISVIMDPGFNAI